MHLLCFSKIQSVIEIYLYIDFPYYGSVFSIFGNINIHIPKMVCVPFFLLWLV